MITPAFELSQDSDFLTLVIRVPYTRTSEFDIDVDGEDFKFYAKPYFLRLTLPGRIVQDGREKASFDIDKGLFTMRVPKETSGQHFEGLHMLTSLLAPTGSRSAQPLVEEIGACSMSEPCQEDKDEEEDFDWQVEQQPYIESSEEDLKKLQKYGFGNLRTGVFSRLQEELSEVIDVEDPENSTPAKRRSDRLDSETTIFCTDHYLLDFYEGEEMRQVHLNFKPWWSELKPDSDAESSKAFVLKCLLAVHKIFRYNEPAYILNDLYITDYCIWIQRVKSKHMVALAEALSKAELNKNDLDLELQILEEAAEMVIDEEEEEQIMKMAQEQTKECEEEDESSSSEEEEDPKSEEEEQNGKNIPDGPAMTCPCSQMLEHEESLIQELGEKLEEELRSREDVPQITVTSSSTAREEAGGVEGLRKTDDSQLPVALDGVKHDTALLEHHQFNVRILNTEELDSDDEDEPNQ
ncbi:protein SHQ1 homolog isoform X2 [Ictalurus furcatus]|uniref:protein SHQ1 homolog isoform X2 n=1 Tax=Ictalurus furcatus TaxID=66913 RepID=UPI002350DB1B|nr:protein SHQ1 homolog isoform X2 [Ictalurus furcatus]